ncbi:hypothetical protein Tco_1273052 [Tanacetum coccineum]
MGIKEAQQSPPHVEVDPKEVSTTKEILVNLAYPEQLVTVGGNLTEGCKAQLQMLLKRNVDVFARVLAPNRGQAVIKEVEEWMKEGIVRPMKYPTWISNLVLVKKGNESWRMYIDFKNINSACPKDYNPLPNIDGKIESVVGFWYKCFLDAYKGYHLVKMAQEDEEKTAFYTDQGTMNLEAYVDDMVIKSNYEKMLLADVAETFDSLRGINMKLNLKKCSFGVEEGKFLGYMVTSEGIQANLKKMKAIADMQSCLT